MSTTTSSQILVRMPVIEDGAAIWNFVKTAGGLDLNSAYAYLMMCDMFPTTCAVAYKGGRLIGFVIGYRKPATPDTLFIWQIGVDPSCRGIGIGGCLLDELLTHSDNADIRNIEATVGPNNAASRGMFLRLSAKLETACIVTEHYEERLFPPSEAHEPELLYRIGPINPKKGVIK